MEVQRVFVSEEVVWKYSVFLSHKAALQAKCHGLA